MCRKRLRVALKSHIPSMAGLGFKFSLIKSKYELLFFFWFICFWAIPSRAQGLLPTLGSGMTLVMLRESYVMPRAEHGLAAFKASALPTVLSFQHQGGCELLRT